MIGVQISPSPLEQLPVILASFGQLLPFPEELAAVEVADEFEVRLDELAGFSCGV
jgi:hypothetical protein